MQVQMQVTLLRVERDAHRRVLGLLVEWGLTGLAKEALADAEGFLTQDFLDGSLHLAVLHNRWEIVEHLLGLGASLNLYESGQSVRPLRAGRLEPLPAPPVWRELLQHRAAFGDEERSLLGFATGVGVLEKHEALLSLGFADDEAALRLLDRIYLNLIRTASGSHGGHQSVGYFTHRRDGSRLEPDYTLFMCMLLMNRPEMARVFFRRLSNQNVSVLLPDSLVACMVCRNLSARVGSSSHHLRSDLERIALEYETFAASILSVAYAHNEKATLAAMEKPLKQYSKWTLLDVVIRAECREVIQQCPDMCIAAVNRRFTGGGNLSEAVARLNQSLVKTCTLDDSLTSSWPKLQQLDPWTKLVICGSMDTMRSLHYLYNVLPSAVIMLWAPISAVLNYNLFGNLFLSGFAIVSEFLPMLDILPTATLAWFCLGQTKSKGGDDDCDDLVELQERPYIPMDDFILEVMVHCLNSYIMTVFILMAPSPLTFVLEVIILLLLIGDVVADIVFAGIEEETKSILDGIKKGLQGIYDETG